MLKGIAVNRGHAVREEVKVIEATSDKVTKGYYRFSVGSYGQLIFGSLYLAKDKAVPETITIHFNKVK